MHYAFKYLYINIFGSIIISKYTHHAVLSNDKLRRYHGAAGAKF